MKTHEEIFMAAVRGIPTHHVTKALSALTPGINWMKCSKTHMAESYANALRSERPVYPSLKRVDVHMLARMANARAKKQRNWETA